MDIVVVPYGNGSELLALKKEASIPIFVVYGVVGKYTTLIDQAIKGNVRANSVIKLSDYTQRKYCNLKNVPNYSAASGMTNAAL